MSSKRAKPQRIDEAINAVLQAEKEVADKASECEQAAALLLHSARKAERRILNRAERRIHKLHRHRKDRLRHDLLEIARSGLETRSRSNELENDRQSVAAAQAMADELLGA